MDGRLESTELMKLRPYDPRFLGSTGEDGPGVVPPPSSVIHQEPVAPLETVTPTPPPRPLPEAERGSRREKPGLAPLSASGRGWGRGFVTVSTRRGRRAAAWDADAAEAVCSPLPLRLRTTPARPLSPGPPSATAKSGAGSRRR